ncbi:MAG: phosphate signaling complex protein PhoU [Burkholderiales bacterium]|nr:phosphate signaling complex protein PhoU [Burkholderiales bacterium]
MNQHTSSSFDSDLEGMRGRVAYMGGLVEAQLSRLASALATNNIGDFETVMTSDYQINALEVEIDELCTHLIATRQPVASDLRLVMATVKSITDLERIGDKAEKIARKAHAIALDGGLQVTRFVELRSMLDKVMVMVRQALDSYARLDPSLAPAVATADKAVDLEFDGITRQLITHMMENPRNISAALDILFVAKAIERIGDHATNMTEYVVYMVQGRDVRHVTPETLVKVSGGA